MEIEEKIKEDVKIVFHNNDKFKYVGIIHNIFICNNII